jgi:hypothetical protein
MRITAEASSPATSPGATAPAHLEAAPPPTDDRHGKPIPHLRLHGKTPLQTFNARAPPNLFLLSYL